MKDKYSKILIWAYKKKIFSEKELFDKFDLNNDKKWYLDVFRGPVNNDDCLIKLCDYKNNEHYCCLSAKGISAYKELARWYEKPLGIILIVFVGGLILAFVVYRLGWNK